MIKTQVFIFLLLSHLRTIFKKNYTLIQNFRNKQSKIWKQYINKEQGLNFKEVKTNHLF